MSRTDDHWLGRVVLTGGVAMSSVTVALLVICCSGTCSRYRLPRCSGTRVARSTIAATSATVAQ